MRAMVVVGLGGSGGATLRFAMQDIQRQLKAAKWDGPIPRAFQFVHIDVPVLPDGGSLGPRQVTDMGGRYVGVAQPGSVYSQLDEGLVNRLSQAGQLDTLAGWRHPAPHEFLEIEQGAGQMRNVGREALSLRLADIGEVLRRAIHDASDPAATAELVKVARLFDPAADSASMTRKPPLAVVVSSIAGGSGASMLSDVAEVLKSVAVGANKRTGREQIAFVYTPEVFASVAQAFRPGTEPNALAAASELVAAQLNSLPTTPREVGLHTSAGLIQPDSGARGPRVTFLVGASNSNGAVLHGQTEIYRSLGRTLSAITLSPQMQESVESYVLGNVANSAAALQDETGLRHGAPRAVWGFDGLGFASVSLGRDRFAEYTAQRLSRVAVKHLLQGHWTRDVEEETETPEQARDARAELALSDVVTALGIPLRPTADQDHQQMLETAWPAAERFTFAQQVTDAVTGAVERTPATQESGFAVSYLSQQLGLTLPRTGLAAKSAMRASVGAWAGSRQAVLEHAVLAVAESAGLPVASAVLALLGDHLHAVADQLLEWEQRKPAADPLDGVRGRVTAVAGRVTRAQLHATVSAADPGETLLTEWSYDLFGLVGRVLADFAGDVVVALRRGLTGQERVLMQASGETPEDRDDQVSSWPKPESVPARFQPAAVDVLVEDVAGYAATYGERLGATFPAGLADDAEHRARAELLVDQLDEAQQAAYDGEPTLVTRAARDGAGAPSVMGRRGSWWSRHLKSQDRQAASASYQPRFSPADVLDRARAWIARQDGAIGSYVREDLATYLRAERTDPVDRDNRERAFVSAFQRALRFASPMVRVDNGLVEAFHGVGESARTLYLFSGVPLAGLPVVPKLADLLEGPGIESTSRQAFLAAVSERGAARIDIFGAYDKVMAPPVFASLAEPIASRWQADNRASFWSNRRARQLPWFVPLSPDAQDAAIRGWYVASVLGLLEVTSDAHRGTRVTLWHADRRRRVEFPHPLLTDPNPHGFVAGADNRRDLLACLLESLPLAMMSCSRTHNADPLLPYAELIRLGAQYEWAVEDWLLRGEVPGDCPPMFTGADAEDTRSRAVARLSAVQGDLQALADRYAVVDRHSLLTFPIGAETAGQQARAVAELVKALENLALGVPVGAGTFL